MVKKTLESRFWLLPDGTLGGFSGESPDAGAHALRILYGDTGELPL